MAVYKIFPIKDSFISLENPEYNYGRDEIFEISSNKKSRGLIQFDSNEINSLIENTISGSNYDVNIKLFLGWASNIPTEYNIEFHPISEIWDVGTGRSFDSPNPQNGVSWNYPNVSSSLWNGGELY